MGENEQLFVDELARIFRKHFAEAKGPRFIAFVMAVVGEEAEIEGHPPILTEDELVAYLESKGAP